MRALRPPPRLTLSPDQDARNHVDQQVHSLLTLDSMTISLLSPLFTNPFDLKVYKPFTCFLKPSVTIKSSENDIQNKWNAYCHRLHSLAAALTKWARSISLHFSFVHFNKHKHLHRLVDRNA